MLQRTYRTYNEAVKKLNSLQTNAQVLEQIRQSRGRLLHKNLPAMRSYIERAGVGMEGLAKLSVIHVTGTKGKVNSYLANEGSTCAFCESLLRRKGYKTGFYSFPDLMEVWAGLGIKGSPHLMEVQERIRINGRSLTKEKFAKYFFDCWDSLLLNDSDELEKDTTPGFFGFLTLMSFHVFLQEKVDVAVIEVGMGGAYDSTNIIRKPVVCGVTSLGMDHVSVLGGTLESIAWQKAGIFKPGVPAFTVPQPENAMTVVADRAREIKIPLHVVPPLGDYPGKLPELGLEGEHQHMNASLSLQLCKTWLLKTKNIGDGTQMEQRELSDEEKPSEEPVVKKAKLRVPVAKPFEISDDFRTGLKNTRWCGRNQVIVRPGVTFYLDGAHTPKSMEASAQWFRKRADEENAKERGPVARVLLFNLTDDRDPHSLLRAVVSCNFDHAIFSTNTISLDSEANNSDLTNFTVSCDSQLQCCVESQRAWMALRGAGFQAYFNHTPGSIHSDHKVNNGQDDGPHSTIFPCVSQAIQWLIAGRDPLIPSSSVGDLPLPEVISLALRLQVLICGSLHLVGSVMKVLGPEVVGEV